MKKLTLKKLNCLIAGICLSCLGLAAAEGEKLVPVEKYGLDKRQDIEIPNLLDNSYLKEGSRLPPVHWNMTKPRPGAFEYGKGQMSRAFKLNAIPDSPVVIGQLGLYLVPGERYRVSGYIRGENFTGSGEIGVIGKAFHRVSGFSFNTKKIKPGWQYFEKEFVHKLSDICRFVMYIQKGSTGSILIERPVLEALTEKGLKGSKRLLPNDDFDERYAQANAKGFRSGPPSKDYKLVWNDEFDGTKLDESKWVNYVLDYRAKRKSMVDTPRCAKLNGKGQIELFTEYEDGIFYSPYAHTKGKYMPKYGYFECRFKIHSTDMVNAAFWMMPENRDLEVNIGPVKCGYEVDIMECILPSCEQISQSTHYRRPDENKKYTIWSGSTLARRMPGFVKGWHTVGFEWTPDYGRFFVDGVESFTFTKDVHPISAAPQYIILSIHGHKNMNAKVLKENKPWRSSIFTVDYVRVYQKTK